MTGSAHRNTSAGERRFVALFLPAFLLLFTALGCFTVRHYGLTFDSAEYYLGDKNFYFWKTLDPAFLDYDLDNVPVHKAPGHPDFFANSEHARSYPHHIWPVGPALTSFSKHLLFTTTRWLDPIDAHHMILVVLVAGLLAALFRFAHRNLGLWPAIFTVAALACYPRFWAHLHNNVKDVPSAVFFSLVLMTFHRGLGEARPVSLWLSALFWGVALATKANAFFLPFILVPWTLWMLLHRRHGQQAVLTRAECLAFLAYPLVGFLLMLVLWPFLLLDFPQRLQAYVQYLLERGASGAGHWQSEPFLNGLYTMPPVVLFFLIVGCVSLTVKAIRDRQRRPFLVLVLLWLTIPVLRVCMPQSVDFDVIRHWLEFVPAAALIAGDGFATLLGWILRRLETTGERRGLRLALCLACLSPTLWWNYRAHPNELVYYNFLIGGLGGAQAQQLPQATDYWGSSYRQGGTWVNEQAAPGSMVIVGVGEHIVQYTAQIWLRQDLKLQLWMGLDQEELLRRSQSHPGSVYLLYITRTERYPAFVRAIEAGSRQPEYQLQVDGGVLLKIHRLR
jgi:hypothetical protein